MTEQTDAVEVEALARLIGKMIEADGNTRYYDLPGSGRRPGGYIARAILASDWLAAREAAARAEALREARDALYRGEGPDMFEDSDIVYGEWLGNRADALAAQVAPSRVPGEES